MNPRNGAVNPVIADDKTARSNMMEMWQESIRRSQQSRKTPQKVAKEQNEAQAALEQRIRNGQEPCPTCMARVYQDESNDSSVSFQAPKHLSAATAGVSVMGHEHEHVTNEDAEAQQEGGVAKSTVALERSICPECGRSYVAGGVTKTVKETPLRRTNAPIRPDGLDLNV